MRRAPSTMLPPKLCPNASRTPRPSVRSSSSRSRSSTFCVDGERWADPGRSPVAPTVVPDHVEAIGQPPAQAEHARRPVHRSVGQHDDRIVGDPLDSDHTAVRRVVRHSTCTMRITSVAGSAASNNPSCDRRPVAAEVATAGRVHPPRRARCRRARSGRARAPSRPRTRPSRRSTRTCRPATGSTPQISAIDRTIEGSGDRPIIRACGRNLRHRPRRTSAARAAQDRRGVGVERGLPRGMGDRTGDAVDRGQFEVVVAALHPAETGRPLPVARLRSPPARRPCAIVRTTPTGSRPMAVSPDSITASVPSNTALATSLTSARVGDGAVIIDSSICVAVITGVAGLDAVPDDALLQVGDVLDRAVDAEIAPCHHDRVRGDDDVAQVVDRGVGLDLGDELGPVADDGADLARRRSPGGRTTPRCTPPPPPPSSRRARDPPPSAS